jgi:hypothetical protein
MRKVVEMTSNSEPKYGYCQDCGMPVDDKNVFVTSYGEVYCRPCGRHNQEKIDFTEDLEAEDWGLWDFDPYTNERGEDDEE